MSDADLQTLLSLGPESGGGPFGTGTDSMRNRYRGVLLGVAAGNALGLPVEGWPHHVIHERFSDGVREVPDRFRDRPWDDDLAQTAILAEALLEGETLDETKLGEKLLQWLRENGSGIGVQTMAVLQKIESGTPAKEAARLIWERSGRTAAGNGAVMRCSPVALRWRLAPRRLIDETRESAAVTHHDGRCSWSAVAVNAVLVRSLAGQATDLGTLALALDSAGAPGEVGDAIRFTQGCPLRRLSLDDPRAMGYTLKAMQAGLWCLSQADDFEDVLVQIVNAGGDTDTNAAVAGAVMGCRVGSAGIPSRWLAPVPGTDHLVRLADRLLERCGVEPLPDQGGTHELC